MKEVPRDPATGLIRGAEPYDFSPSGSGDPPPHAVLFLHGWSSSPRELRFLARRVAKKMAIVLYGREFWTRMVDFSYLVETGMISREDLKLFRICDGVDEAFDYLTRNLHPTRTQGRRIRE